MATFGKTAIGATPLTEWEYLNRLVMGGFTAPSDIGPISKITWYGSGEGATVNAKAVLCDSSKVILAVSNVTAVTTTVGWWDFTFASPPTPTASATCYMGIINDGGGVGASLAAYEDTGGDPWRDTSNSYTTPTNPTDAVDDGTYDFSIYATYTAAGGGHPAMRRFGGVQHAARIGKGIY